MREIIHEMPRDYFCQYESREDRIKAIEAELKIFFKGETASLSEEFRRVHVLNLPSIKNRVHIYNSLYWQLLEPELLKKQTRFKLLKELPKDAGQPNFR